MSNFPDFSSHGYLVERELGQNRAGGRVTYLGTSTTTLQQVVIKQFQFAQAGASWSDYQAYEQEIKVLQRLDHPSIPFYLDSFETSAGFCLVTEYKQAPSLAQPRHFTPLEIKQIAGAILKVLSYLQQQHPPIIHRDIKPENILVDRSRQMKVYLVDFGFARMGGGEVAASSVVKGTLGFMPPEQMFNRQLTEASDLYSLGTTLICLLTKTKSTEIGSLIDETSRINFKHLVPDLSLEFVNWLETMVAPSLKNRYPNAAVALNALQQVDVVGNTTRLNSSPNLVRLATLSFISLFATAFYLSKHPQPTSATREVRATSETGRVPLAVRAPQKAYMHDRYLAISPDSRTLAIGSLSNSKHAIKVWDLKTGQEIRTLSGHLNGVSSVVFSSDSQYLVSGSRDNTIKIWNIKTSKEIQTLSGDLNWVVSLAISPDGQTFASSGSGYIKLWNLATGKLLQTFPWESHNTNFIAFSSDGKTLIGSKSLEDKIHVWDVKTGQLIHTLTGHSDDVTGIAIHPDGKTIVSGSYDNTIKVWNLATGKLLRTLTGHSDSVLSVAISPDGQTLASGSDDDTVKLWNFSTGELLRTLSTPRGVFSVAFSPDGQTLVSSSREGTIKVWNLHTGETIYTLSSAVR